MSMLEVRSLTKRFGEKTVLHRVNLSVDRHEVVCLIGASGSGKSTLLKCINLLIPVDEGEIILDGVPIRAGGEGEQKAREKMGIVFQSFNLFPHMTVLNNISIGPRKVRSVPRDRAEQEARSLLGRFGLAEKAEEYPDRLSGGQQQRVAIIRSLAMRPEVLLLDEITSALDPVLVGEVLSVLRDLKDEGLTMVIATHEMGFAKGSADRVAFLHAGTVWELGTPDLIFTAPERPETQDFLRRVVESGRL